MQLFDRTNAVCSLYLAIMLCPEFLQVNELGIGLAPPLSYIPLSGNRCAMRQGCRGKTVILLVFIYMVHRKRQEVSALDVIISRIISICLFRSTEFSNRYLKNLSLMGSI